MKNENLNVVGDKNIYDTQGGFVFWQRLCSEEFLWSEENMSSAHPDKRAS